MIPNMDASALSLSRTNRDYLFLDERRIIPVSYTHLRAHETVLDLVCRLLLEKKNLLYTSPSPRTRTRSRMPSSA